MPHAAGVLRLLLAPDKFRGTFTAREVCDLLARGMARAPGPIEVDAIPLADGGEGTLDVLLASLGGSRASLRAHDPLLRPIEAPWGVTDDGAAVIESATFCGLALLAPGEEDPLHASSRGVGEAVAAALDAGISRILIGLGGSATVDGGAGMARALGYRLLDARGGEIAEGGGDLARVARIDDALANPALAGCRVTAFYDVANPLLGPDGAVRVFAPQKGARPGDLPTLESGLAALARAGAATRRVAAPPLESMAGAGAAGGLGMGAVLFLGADLRPGAQAVMDLTGFDRALSRCDLVVTGEGSFDAQSGWGKVTGAVLAAAAAAGRPALVVAGRWDGSLPRLRPPRLGVLTGDRLEGRPQRLDAPDLESLGEIAAIEARESVDGLAG